jgi:hypothetical protein
MGHRKGGRYVDVVRHLRVAESEVIEQHFRESGQLRTRIRAIWLITISVGRP